MGAPLASKPELSECCECTQICSISPLAAGGFCPQIKYRAMAADTTTAAARPAQTTWLEPLVNSPPRAASSSLVESCRRRLIGLYLMPEGAQPNIDFVFTVGRIRILSCSKPVTSGAIRPTPKQPTEDSLLGRLFTDVAAAQPAIAPLPAYSTHPLAPAMRVATAAIRIPSSPDSAHRASRSR